MSKLFKTLSVLAVLVSGAAFAGERHHDFDGDFDDYDYHPATAVPVIAPPAPVGHYELRQVRTFVPAHWTFIRRHHHLDRVFNPAHYELVSQQVWVNGPEYGYAPVAPPPPVQNQGGVSFGLSFNG